METPSVGTVRTNTDSVFITSFPKSLSEYVSEKNPYFSEVLIRQALRYNFQHYTESIPGDDTVLERNMRTNPVWPRELTARKNSQSVLTKRKPHYNNRHHHPPTHTYSPPLLPPRAPDM